MYITEYIETLCMYVYVYLYTYTYIHNIYCRIFFYNTDSEEREMIIYITTTTSINSYLSTYETLYSLQQRVFGHK